jgi:predicted murein hydrolase (TIGR00659 family)
MLSASDDFFKTFSNFDLTIEDIFFYCAIPMTVLLYLVVRHFQIKTKLKILNPLLIPAIIIVITIIITKVDPIAYQNGTRFITALLEPAVVVLAIPLYQKFDLIKKQALLILICCTLSIFLSYLISYVTCYFANVDHSMISTMGARSITTPLAMDVSDRTGGIKAITACIVCIVGIMGAIIGFPLMKLFKIRNKKAQGLAMGACAHAVGTSAATEKGLTEGAFSSLSLIVCGVLTTMLATPIFLLLNFIDKVLQ